MNMMMMIQEFQPLYSSPTPKKSICNHTTTPQQQLQQLIPPYLGLVNLQHIHAWLDGSKGYASNLLV